MSLFKNSVLGLALAMTGLIAAAPAQAQNYRGGYDQRSDYRGDSYRDRDHDRNWRHDRDRERERARRWHRHHHNRDSYRYDHDRRDTRYNDRDYHRGY